MSEAASEALPAEADSTPIDVDVYCFGCRYNLRGIDLAAVCPECAHPVRLSFDPELVLRQTPRTREHLARRLRQFQWWTILAALQVLFLPFLINWYPPRVTSLPLAMRLGIDAAQYIAPLLWLAAWSRLWFSRHDFGFHHSAIAEPERPRLERIILITLFLFWGGCHIVLATTPAPHRDADAIRIVVLVLMFLLFFNWMHYVIALRVIARLCQSPYLQSRGTALLILLPFALICGLPVVIGPPIWLLMLAWYTWGVRQALLNQPTSKIPNHLVA